MPLKIVRVILTQEAHCGTQHGCHPEEFLAGAAGDGFRAFLERCLDKIRVALCDDFELDLFGTGGFAFADVGAIGEAFAIHLPHHG